MSENPFDGLLKPISQNIIDFWAKQMKTYYQYYFGENEIPESADTPVTTNDLVFSGNVFLSIPNNNNYYGGDSNGYGLLSTYLSIYPPYENNPVLEQEIIAYTDNSYNYGSMSEWANGRPLNINWIYNHYTKNPSYPEVIYSPDAPNIWNSLNLRWTRYPDTFDSGSFALFNTPIRISFDSENQWSVNNNNMPTIRPRGGAPYSVYVGAIDLDISNVYSNQHVVNFSQNFMNYYQYTTSNGDTITTYYTDNSIINDSNGIPLSFNDYRDYMNNILGVISENYPDFDSSIVVPSWDELDYVDSDFYIEPLHQYGELPTAPTFENELDLADYPQTIGSVASTFVDFLPASISALLAGAVIVSAIVSFVRRD